MSSRITKENEKTESVWTSVQEFLSVLLNGILYIYIFLILGVLPFYNQEGYAHIGTDKSEFFNKISVGLGKIALPVLICYVIVSVFAVVLDSKKIERKGQREQSGGTGIVQKIKKFWAGNHLSATDIFAGIYGVSLLLSYMCSNYKETALWGTRWWHMGLYPQLILVAAYFLISRLWKKSALLFYLVFPVSGVVFLLGVLNRFGIFPIDMKVENVEFLSTIGNMNWYCGYLVTVFFGGIFLFWAGNAFLQVLFSIYMLIGFMTLVTQGSSSGIVTLLGMLLLFFGLSVSDGQKMQRFLLLMLLLSTACLGMFCVRKVFPDSLTYTERITELFTNSALPMIMTVVSLLLYVWVRACVGKGRYPRKYFQKFAEVLFLGTLAATVLVVVLMIVNTLHPGSLGRLSEIEFLTFSPTWGSNRGATWGAGIRCFVEQDFLHKLVGAGPDCMADFLYQAGSPKLVSMVKETFGSAYLANAHNEWLTVLVNNGLIGCVSYIGMVVSGIVRYIRKRDVNVFAAAVGICLLAYTINNMFSFQQTMNVSTMFVLFGMGEAFARKEK